MDSVQEYICYIFFKKKKREEGRHFVMVKDLYVDNWINGIDLLKYCYFLLLLTWVFGLAYAHLD
jgi:hypothetical protein